MDEDGVEVESVLKCNLWVGIIGRVCFISSLDCSLMLARQRIEFL